MGLGGSHLRNDGGRGEEEEIGRCVGDLRYVKKSSRRFLATTRKKFLMPLSMTKFATRDIYQMNRLQS